MMPVPMIAIVDDDNDVRVALASLVQSLGYEVRTYGSGVEFLQESLDGDPACMIADVQMPSMSGDELQRQLLKAGRRIPMIFMTGFPTEAVRNRVLEAGAVCFLNKPADGDVIIQCLEEALEIGAAQ